MRNSAISKSNHNTFPDQRIMPGFRNKEENSSHSSFQKSHKIQNNKHLRSSLSLFKGLRQSAQAKQNPPKPEISKGSRNIYFSEQSGSPLPNRMKKQETYIEPNSFDKGNPNEKLLRLNNEMKQTNPTFKEIQKNTFKDFNYGQLAVNSRKFIEFNGNNKHQIRNGLDQKKQKHQNFGLGKHFQNAQSNDDQIFGFGEGLENIQTQRKGQQQKSIFQRGTGMFRPQKEVKSFEHVSSTFSPIPSSISGSKRLPNKVTDAQMRSTGRNFFKRPSSLTVSQDFLKTVGSQTYKGDKREKGNLNSTVSPFKQSDSRAILQNKRSSSQARSTNNSFNMMSQIVSDFNTRTKKDCPHLSLANSLTRIIFKYNGSHATTLYNYRLKIKNESSVRLSIKIKCTSPRSYEVHPSTDTILNPSEIFSVSIQMKMFTHDLNHTTMKHDLSRYRSDKFKIMYWTTDFATQDDYIMGEKVLPVVIEQTQEEKLRNEGQVKNLSNQKIKQATQQKQVEMYKKLIEKNKLKVQEIDTKISGLNQCEFRHKYFSKHVFFFFALVGTGLGFWLA